MTCIPNFSGPHPPAFSRYYLGLVWTVSVGTPRAANRYTVCHPDLLFGLRTFSLEGVIIFMTLALCVLCTGT